ncbi:MAG: hypothetical protein KBD60_09325 [Sterolibacterium sp.]|nr:hypothetical protein [Sterolibacterium sp.]
MLTRYLFLLLCLLMPILAQAAGARVLILADATAVTRQLQYIVDAELRRGSLQQSPVSPLSPASLVAQVMLMESDPSAQAGGETLPAADVLLAVGPVALRQALAQPSIRRIVAVLVTRDTLELSLAQKPLRAGREVHAIVLDQPLTRYLDLIHLALPKAKNIGLMSGGDDKQAAQYRSLEKQAEERGMKLTTLRLVDDTSAGLISRLDELLEQSDVLLALPDTRIHNRANVQPLLLTTYRAGVPVVAYSEAYGRAGALLALYSTPEQLAQQASEVLLQLLQSRNPLPHSVQMPKYFSVYVNGAVARSLGLSISSGIILRERLR